jgi:hypothetical protein
VTLPNGERGCTGSLAVTARCRSISCRKVGGAVATSVRATGLRLRSPEGAVVPLDHSERDCASP